MTNLEFFALVRRKDVPSGPDFDQKLFRLERHIERRRRLGYIRHLPVILTDVGAWAMSVVNFAQREEQQPIPNRQPAGRAFFLPLVGRMAEMKIDALGRRRLRERFGKRRCEHDDLVVAKGSGPVGLSGQQTVKEIPAFPAADTAQQGSDLGRGQRGRMIVAGGIRIPLQTHGVQSRFVDDLVWGQ